MCDDTTCQDCDKVFKCRADLAKHKNKKFKCTEGQYPCRTCGKRFRHQPARSKHEKTCQGRQKTVSGQQKEIDRLKKAMETIDARHQQMTSEAGPSSSINCDIANVHNGDNITVIQNNITVNTFGKEDASFVQAIPSDELYDRVKHSENILALSEFFKLLRLNPDRPQNHNMLLMDKDADEIHYKSKNGWKTGGTESVLDGCLAKDGLLLQCCLNKNQDYESLPEEQKQLWKYIALEVMPHIGAVAYPPFQKYYESAREYLCESTMALCAAYPVAEQAVMTTSPTEDLGRLLLIEKSKEKQIQSQIELTKLQLELKKLELGGSVAI